MARVIKMVDSRNPPPPVDASGPSEPVVPNWTFLDEDGIVKCTTCRIDVNLESVNCHEPRHKEFWSSKKGQQEESVLESTGEKEVQPPTEESVPDTHEKKDTHDTPANDASPVAMLSKWAGNAIFTAVSNSSGDVTFDGFSLFMQKYSRPYIIRDDAGLYVFTGAWHDFLESNPDFPYRSLDKLSEDHPIDCKYRPSKSHSSVRFEKNMWALFIPFLASSSDKVGTAFPSVKIDTTNLVKSKDFLLKRNTYLTLTTLIPEFNASSVAEVLSLLYKQALKKLLPGATRNISQITNFLGVRLDPVEIEENLFNRYTVKTSDTRAIFYETSEDGKRASFDVHMSTIRSLESLMTFTGIRTLDDLVQTMLKGKVSVDITHILASQESDGNDALYPILKGAANVMKKTEGVDILAIESPDLRGKVLNELETLRARTDAILKTLRKEDTPLQDTKNLHPQPVQPEARTLPEITKDTFKNFQDSLLDFMKTLTVNDQNLMEDLVNEIQSAWTQKTRNSPLRFMTGSLSMDQFADQVDGYTCYLRDSRRRFAIAILKILRNENDAIPFAIDALYDEKTLSSKKTMMSIIDNVASNSEGTNKILVDVIHDLYKSGSAKKENIASLMRVWNKEFPDELKKDRDMNEDTLIEKLSEILKNASPNDQRKKISDMLLILNDENPDPLLMFSTSEITEKLEKAEIANINQVISFWNAYVLTHTVEETLPSLYRIEKIYNARYPHNKFRGGNFER